MSLDIDVLWQNGVGEGSEPTGTSVSLLSLEGDFKGVYVRQEEQLFSGLGQPGKFSWPRDLSIR